MANQQLVDYIKSQLKLGVTKEDLQKAIVAAGWSSQESVDAFLAAEGKAPPMPASPATPIPPTPAAPLQPSPASIKPASGPAVRPRIAVPMMEEPRSRLWLWVLIAIVALVAAAAAVYMFVPLAREVVSYYLGGGTPPAESGVPVPSADVGAPGISASSTPATSTLQTATTTSAASTSAQ